MVNTTELVAALTAPFQPAEVKFKPQAVKGDRALAIAYVDARVVQDRLDEVMGLDNWADTYEPLPNGSMLCRLRLRFNGEWIEKADVGSPSEQPDEHDRVKASVSDALKRAAVKFGIGRYLYRLPNVWTNYDPQKKQFTQPPQLPEWAKPKKPAPKTMGEVRARINQAEDKLVQRKKCGKGAMLAYVVAQLAEKGHKGEFDKLPPAAIPLAQAAANDFYEKHTAPPPDPLAKYPEKLRGLYKLAHEVFGGETAEWTSWLDEQGIPNAVVLDMIDADAIRKLGDKLGAKLAAKQTDDAEPDHPAGY